MHTYATGPWKSSYKEKFSVTVGAARSLINGHEYEV